MAIHKILVPTDFSLGAELAMEQAIELARAFGAQVMLFHTYELPIPPAIEGGGYWTDELPRRAEAAARLGLDGALAQARRRWDGPASAVTAMIGIGPAALRIVDEAQRGGYDLIVMGTHGRSGLKRLLIGSVAERVVCTATCPVLTVRERLGAVLPHDPPNAEIAGSSVSGASAARFASK
jgi:nucleotide-binding universal stress UspA family protein